MKKPQPPKEYTVRVIRPFCMEGEPVAVDTVLVLPVPFAQELINANKVVRAKEQPVASPAREEKAAVGKTKAKASSEKPSASQAQAANQSPVAPAQGE